MCTRIVGVGCTSTRVCIHALYSRMCIRHTRVFCLWWTRVRCTIQCVCLVFRMHWSTCTRVCMRCTRACMNLKCVVLQCVLSLLY